MLPDLSKLCLDARNAPSVDAKRDGEQGRFDASRPAKVARSDELAVYEAWLGAASDDEMEREVKRAIRRCESRDVALDERFLNARELAITRVLQANSVIRARFGVRPFFPEDARVNYLDVMSDATVVDTSSAATSAVTFVRSWMEVGQQSMSRHAMTLLTAPSGESGASLYLVDSNGSNGSHALRFEHLQHAPFPISVLETLAVQTGVQDTRLWQSGQVLGKFMGWCSLWTMCLCELVAVGGLSVAGVQRLMSPRTEEEMTRLLVVVRESTIRTFHHAVSWLDRNGYTRSLQFALLNPFKVAPATQETSFKTIEILGQTISVEIDEDHVLIGACKKRRALDFETHGYSVFMRWEIVNGPLLFTIGLPVALDNLKTAIGDIRRAIEGHFDTKLPPFRARGEDGRRVWILDDYAVNVPKVLQDEVRAIKAMRGLQSKMREQYRATQVPWLENAKARLSTNKILNINAQGRAFVFKDEFDLRTEKTDDAAALDTDPAILYKKSLDETFPLWKTDKAKGLALDDLAVKLVASQEGRDKRVAYSFGIGRDFGRSDVETLVNSIPQLRSMDKFADVLAEFRTTRSLKFKIFSRSGEETMEQVHNAFSEWKWDVTARILFETLERAVAGGR